MHIKRTSSAKGRPPPFRPFSAVVPATQTSGAESKSTNKPRVRASSASAVSFQMQLQFNLSRPVLSTHLQLKNDATTHIKVRQRGGRSSTATSTPSSSATTRSGRSPLGLPMDVSASQTQRTMTARRSARQRRQQAIGDVTHLSGTQCEQNRKRFETALNVADSIQDGNTTNSSIQYGSSSTPEPCSTSSFQSSSQQVSLLSPTRSQNLGSTVFSFNTTFKSSLPSITDTSSSPAPSPNTLATGTAADRNFPEYFRAASCNIRSRTNGPTIIGSPLYNRQPKQFLPDDSAGPRTSTYSGDLQYNHERYKTRTAAVQQNMERVSSAYKVLTSPRYLQHPHTDQDVSPQNTRGVGTSQRHPNDFSDIFLIPTADAEAEDFSAEAYFRDHPDLLTSTLLDEPEELKPPVIELPVEPEVGNDVVLGGEVEDVQKDEVVCDGPAGEPPLPSEDIQPHTKVAFEPVTESKDKEKPPGKPTLRQKKSAGNLKSASKTRFKEEKPDPTPSKPTSANKERRGSAVSGSDASSSLPSRPSSATYWRMKSWVDDVTVTSDKESDADVGADANPRTQSPDGKPEANSKTRPEVKSPEKSKPEAPLKSALKKTAEAPKPLEEVNALPGNPMEDGNDVKKEEPVNIMNLNDLKRIRVKLPDFICPSSQDKSKESAVLDWLETTRNHWSMKTSPLL